MATEPTSPQMAPTTPSRRPRPRNLRSSSARLAPIAIRMPISCVLFRRVRDQAVDAERGENHRDDAEDHDAPAAIEKTESATRVCSVSMRAFRIGRLDPAPARLSADARAARLLDLASARAASWPADSSVRAADIRADADLR